MNLYFRLMYILLKGLFSPKIFPLAESKLSFYALPTDCDLNLHVTNSRYMSFMDLGRTYLVGQLNLLPKLYKRRWGPIVHAAELTFLKPIMIGKQFELITKIIYWDEKYFYMEQRFISHGQVCAIGNIRGLFIGKKSKIPSENIIALLDHKVEVPPMPEFVKQWQTLLQVKKNS